MGLQGMKLELCRRGHGADSQVELQGQEIPAERRQWEQAQEHAKDSKHVGRELIIEPMPSTRNCAV